MICQTQNSTALMKPTGDQTKVTKQRYSTFMFARYPGDLDPDFRANHCTNVIPLLMGHPPLLATRVVHFPQFLSPSLSLSFTS